MGEKSSEVAGLRKSFDTWRWSRAWTMQVHQVEFLTLLGPSGCGKTTTLRIDARV